MVSTNVKGSIALPMTEELSLAKMSENIIILRQTVNEVESVHSLARREL